MRIGILTFHNVPNYGAVLQAFALKKYLSQQGHTVQIIDYQCKGNNDEFAPENCKKSFSESHNLTKKIIKKILFKILCEKNYGIKYERFSSFSKEHYDLQKNVEDIFNQYDLIFCGSDQIWNPMITDGFQEPYFGTQLPRKAVVASYAASCGDIGEFDAATKNAFFSKLRGLDYLAVREASLCSAIEDAGMNCVCTVDPTMLLSAEEYVKTLNLQKRTERKFLLEYSLQKNGELDALAKQIAAEKQLEIIKVCGYLNTGLDVKGVYDMGPVEFLEKLYNAEYVVTNSFHGVALSLVFKKNFNVCLPVSRKSRILDLLKKISLQNRIHINDKFADTDSIDYQKVTPRMEEMTNESKEYISKILEMQL